MTNLMQFEVLQNQPGVFEYHDMIQIRLIWKCDLCNFNYWKMWHRSPQLW